MTTATLVSSSDRLLHAAVLSGHARAYVSFDVLYRLLSALGYDVLYVRNFTDVDDKIIRRAHELGQSAEAVAQRFIVEFHRDMETLGCSSPSEEPCATDYIPHMIQMIQRIVDNGHGYAADGGDVFFDTASLENYGRLSKRSAEDNRAGERVAVDVRKRNASDFALWKSAKEGELSWQSPWGPGRPGWHIECSAMIRDRIGTCVDIHGGGSDLVFPHHENELAQSQAAASPCEKKLMLHGTDFVRYWVHNGFVTINTEKMSKSLGNFFTIREVVEKHHPLALRWMLLSTQYRQQLNYSDQLIEEATSNVYYLCQTLSDALSETQWHPADHRATLSALHGDSKIVRAFVEALCDDINSAAALAGIYRHLKELNELMHTKKVQHESPPLSPIDRSVYLKGRKDKQRMAKLMDGCRDILCCLDVLGFEVDRPDQVIREMKSLSLKRAEMSEEDVMAWIRKRDQVRSLLNWTPEVMLESDRRDRRRTTREPTLSGRSCR